MDNDNPANIENNDNQQVDNVSIYKFGRSVYTVRAHFCLDSKETITDVVSWLIQQDIDDMINK